MTLANVSQPTTAIANHGHGVTLPAGRYEVAHLDGVDENSVLYIHGPDNGALMCIDRNDPNIAIEEV